MNDKIKAARVALGGFLKERRRQMGRTEKEIADFLGISAETVKGVESGRFACDIDLLFNFCRALEIKPFFAPLEEVGKGSQPKFGDKNKFLFAPDEESGLFFEIFANKLVTS